MITHEQLVETFGEDEVFLVPTELIEDQVTDPEARRVLTEVGLPDSLFETLSFEDFTDGPARTLAETFFSTAQGMPESVRDYLIVANGVGGGVACLDGADGRVYWFRPGDTEPYGLLSTSLGQFVEVVKALYARIMPLGIYLPPDADEQRVAAIQRRIEETMEGIVDQVRELDPAVFDNPSLIWQVIIIAALEDMIHG
ncbi:SUKH-4 family immunity protein [Streptomyces sp. NPDC021020]|uniref:SUKH-4 family immunity protein n=1 Tax=Streptomyces sp. NPDC021020 TaxID=3365109 RepID=UPI0037BB048A